MMRTQGDSLVIVTDFNRQHILFLDPGTLEILSKWGDADKYKRGVLMVRKFDEEHFVVSESGGVSAPAGLGRPTVVVFRIDRPNPGSPWVSYTEVKRMQAVHECSIYGVDVIPPSHGSCSFGRIIAMDNPTHSEYGGGKRPQLVVWDSGTGEPLAKLEAPAVGSSLKLCSVSPSCFFATGSSARRAAGQIRKYDLERSKPLSVVTLLSQLQQSEALDVHSESGVVFGGGIGASSKECNCELWDNSLRECVGKWREDDSYFCSAQFVPDKHLVVVGMSNGAMSSRDLRKLDKRLHFIPVHGYGTTVQGIARVGPTEFVTVSYGEFSIARRSLGDSEVVSSKNQTGSWKYDVCTIGMKYDDLVSSSHDDDEVSERIGFLIETLVERLSLCQVGATVSLRYPAWTT